MTTLADERGSITGFVAVIATALVMVAGMAYDGGQVIHAHNAARNDAEQAARAGAQQIDITHLRQTSEPASTRAKPKPPPSTISPRSARPAPPRWMGPTSP